MQRKIDIDALTTKKKAYQRNALVASGTGIAAVLVEIFSKNRYVKAVANAVQIASIAVDWYFVGKADGIDEVNKSVYIVYDDGDEMQPT